MRHAADSPVYIGVRRRGSARALRCRFRTEHRGPSSPFNRAVVPRFYGSSPLTAFSFFYFSLSRSTTKSVTDYTVYMFFFISPPLPITDHQTPCRIDTDYTRPRVTTVVGHNRATADSKNKINTVRERPRST
uniref:Uncharacterized protein n=1 Tax=Human betaherpesvirus 6 TaxID=10368 RepID=A0A5P9U5B0_9BETA|nr:hypothetical protein [Human betaherpesvirus 6]QFW75495.1 hypothetical protein [Human betaherpesvirus 6]